MRLAAQYDDEEADARAARFAGSLAPTFSEARRIALGGGRLRQRAAAMNALEGCARAFALRLWGPLLATHPGGEPHRRAGPRGDVEHSSRARPRRSSISSRSGGRARRRPDADLPLEVLAIRLGGYALDACGEDSDLGPGRGPTAHDTCLWLRKVEGLADGSRELPAPLKGASRARCSGASSTRRAAPRSARSTTCGGSVRSPRGGRSSSIARRCCCSSRRRCR